MITLPKAGFLTDGKKFFDNGDLDSAEMNFKKMLHHNPEHAACHYMLGLVYLNKNHINDGIKEVEKAVKKVPWKKEWRETLIKAYDVIGEPDRIKQFDGGVD
ncbi:MAG: tetratricopeptide repeat protein [Campylobacterota bacterium]|nr:tetratricopeptide repeat protein [Campylobacterota bacterium]